MNAAVHTFAPDQIEGLACPSGIDERYGDPSDVDPLSDEIASRPRDFGDYRDRAPEQPRSEEYRKRIAKILQLWGIGPGSNGARHE